MSLHHYFAYNGYSKKFLHFPPQKCDINCLPDYHNHLGFFLLQIGILRRWPYHINFYVHWYRVLIAELPSFPTTLPCCPIMIFDLLQSRLGMNSFPGDPTYIWPKLPKAGCLKYPDYPTKIIPEFFGISRSYLRKTFWFWQNCNFCSIIHRNVHWILKENCNLLLVGNEKYALLAYLLWVRIFTEVSIF